MASARQWSRVEMAMQLVWALKGAALEVLNQLPAAQRSSYSKVTKALERRTRFRARVRGPGETLTRLAQNLEVLVRRGYPEASEMIILLRDQFVDAIDKQQLRIYVQQAHPKDLQEALARGLDLELFLWTMREQPSGNRSPHKVKAKSGGVAKPPSSLSPPPAGEFQEAGPTQYKPCCYNCGKGHRMTECTLVPTKDSKEAAGNWKGLVERVERQSESKRPQSA
ncbi:hypothetical protein E2C01_043582 [Portunus trituberculatus]|uniref:CCHC-type domain-containing protein n=1 Tax=Portunus trituberculatus TaxID=210409 RepID=A0A5B7FXY4_PORTR|nr:hypothetical protein [Portunus trituberculatus]